MQTGQQWAERASSAGAAECVAIVGGICWADVVGMDDSDSEEDVVDDADDDDDDDEEEDDENDGGCTAVMVADRVDCAERLALIVNPAEEDAVVQGLAAVAATTVTGGGLIRARICMECNVYKRAEVTCDELYTYHKTGRILSIFLNNLGNLPLVFQKQHFGQRGRHLDDVAQLFDGLVEKFLNRLHIEAREFQIFRVGFASIDLLNVDIRNTCAHFESIAFVCDVHKKWATNTREQKNRMQ